jgi:hypothetical protein
MMHNVTSSCASPHALLSACDKSHNNGGKITHEPNQHVNIYLYIYIHIYIHTHTHTHTHICMYIYASIHLNEHTCIHIHTCKSITATLFLRNSIQPQTLFAASSTSATRRRNVGKQCPGSVKECHTFSMYKLNEKSWVGKSSCRR